MVDIIIKFTDSALQPNKTFGNHDSPVQRTVGFVEIKNLFPLFDHANLTANPRQAKKNSVVNEIVTTLDDSPELFRYKSKGILLAITECEPLQRQRFRLELNDKVTDGILDGGHNMFAIGSWVLRSYMGEREWKQMKTWDDLKAEWRKFRKLIDKDKNNFNTLVPVELLTPVSNDDEIIESFDMAIFSISQARNNNASVSDEAFQNKQGLYSDLRQAIPNDLAKIVEWKPGEVEDSTEKHPIKVRDLISLCWVPLNFLHENNLLPEDLTVSPQNIYRNKGECSSKFGILMRSDNVTSSDDRNGTARKLKDKGVKSALKIAADFPKLVDLIYSEFPDAYNKKGGGGYKFGKRKQVKKYDPARYQSLKNDGKDTSGYTNSQPVTHYYREPIDWKYPEAYIIPLVNGLTALMKIKDGQIEWAVDDIFGFVSQALKKIVPMYEMVLDNASWDPQTVGKSPSAHEFAKQLFDMQIPK